MSWERCASRTVWPCSTVPASGSSSFASTRVSDDLPEPFTPTSPIRSPGPMCQSIPFSSTFEPNASPTPSASITLPPRREEANLSSSTRSRASGSSAIIAFAASIRNLGLEVRAGGPRRSQASSFRSSCWRRSSRAEACRSRSARASTYAA